MNIYSYLFGVCYIFESTCASPSTYISGPITDQDDYFENFAKAETKLSRLGFAAINPAAINAAMPSTTTHAEYMHVSFALIDLCDRLYMLPGWEMSEGARSEYFYAAAKGKEIKLMRDLPEE